MFQFKKQESDSGLDLDHRWKRSLRIGAVSVFESVRVVAYSDQEPARLIYLRCVALDEEYQKRLSIQRFQPTTVLIYLVTLMWTSLYVILGKILTKEYIILNAEYEKQWQKKWSFAADIFVSVRREKKLKEIGI
jgi:hypothetical protein